MPLPAGSSSYQITGLDAGSSYMITVTASNSVGGSSSDTVTAVTGTIRTKTLVLCAMYVFVFSTAVPAHPVVTVQAGIDSILVCWSDAGPLVDRVLVEWSASGGRTLSATVMNGLNSYSITGLEQGTGYIVSVTAVNSAGSSDSASVSTVTQISLNGSGVCDVTATIIITSTVSIVPPTSCPGDVTKTITSTPVPATTEQQSGASTQYGHAHAQFILASYPGPSQRLFAHIYTKCFVSSSVRTRLVRFASSVYEIENALLVSSGHKTFNNPFSALGMSLHSYQLQKESTRRLTRKAVATPKQ